MKTLTYKQAIRNASKNIDDGQFDAFQASTMLATIFNKPKEETMDDLINFRRVTK